MSNRRPYPAETGLAVLFSGLLVLIGLGLLALAFTGGI